MSLVVLVTLPSMMLVSFLRVVLFFIIISLPWTIVLYLLPASKFSVILKCHLLLVFDLLIFLIVFVVGMQMSATCGYYVHFYGEVLMRNI